MNGRKEDCHVASLLSIKMGDFVDEKMMPTSKKRGIFLDDRV